MAQAVKPARGPSPADPRRAGPGRVWLRWAVLGFALGLIGGVGGRRAWHWYHFPARVQAALPPRPDLAGKPAVQAELIAAAEARTRRREDALAGVAELGRLYHANNYPDAAAACWRFLRAEQPAEARWPYYLADLRRTAGDSAELTALLGATVQLAPDYSPAWLQLANLELKTGAFESASAHFQRRLALAPGDFYATLGLARIAQQQGNAAEARRLVEQLVRDFPQQSTGHNLYAEMLTAAGDTEGARKHRWLGRETGRFREADDPWLNELQAWCYDYSRLCVLATIEDQTERGDGGKSLLERAIRLAPENPVAYELLGGLYRKRGDAAKARDTFAEGLQRAQAPKPSPMFYVNYSETYRTLKQPEEALRIIQLGLAQVGGQLELYDALGVAYADLGRQEDAIAAFREVLARNPNDTNSNYNLGMSLLVLGRQAEARAAFERSLVQQPSFMKALSLLGRWDLESGRLASAGRYLLPLYESHPEVPEVRQMVAQWHFLSGAAAEKARDVAGAEAHYRAGLAAEPKRADLLASLGVLCLVQGRPNDAVGPLETYHTLQPNNPQSALFLGQVYLQLGRIDEARRTLLAGEELAKQSGNATTAGYFREILQHL